MPKKQSSTRVSSKQGASKKKSYRIQNWSEYNKALIERGNITFWFNEKAIQKWHNLELSGKQGRSNIYSDVAIECMLMLKLVFHLSLRAVEGLVVSLVKLSELPIKVPHYSTVSRRQGSLSITLEKLKTLKKGSARCI